MERDVLGASQPLRVRIHNTTAKLICTPIHTLSEAQPMIESRSSHCTLRLQSLNVTSCCKPDAAMKSAADRVMVNCDIGHVSQLVACDTASSGCGDSNGQ